MINDCLLYIFLEFHDHKQKIVKAYKKILFPEKFQIFEIRCFDSTATIFKNYKDKNYNYFGKNLSNEIKKCTKHLKLAKVKANLSLWTSLNDNRNITTIFKYGFL